MWLSHRDLRRSGEQGHRVFEQVAAFAELPFVGSLRPGLRPSAGPSRSDRRNAVQNAPVSLSPTLNPQDIAALVGRHPWWQPPRPGRPLGGSLGPCSRSRPGTRTGTPSRPGTGPGALRPRRPGRCRSGLPRTGDPAVHSSASTKVTGLCGWRSRAGRPL